MIIKDISMPQESNNSFNVYSEVLINGKKYIVERHFNGSRDFRQAVFTAAGNEAKRDISLKETA